MLTMLKLRLFFSWVVGIILVILGVWLELFFKESYGMIENSFFLYLIFQISIRSGIILYSGKFYLDFNESNFIQLMFGIGLLLYAIINQIIALIIDPAENNFYFKTLSLVAFLGIVSICLLYYNSKIEMIRKNDEKLKNNSSN